jgi:hypothetical protein
VVSASRNEKQNATFRKSSIENLGLAYHRFCRSGWRWGWYFSEHTMDGRWMVRKSILWYLAECRGETTPLLCQPWGQSRGWIRSCRIDLGYCLDQNCCRFPFTI